MKGDARRFGLTLAALALALAFGHFVVYRRLILPSLPWWRAVPWWLRATQFAPEAAVCLWAGEGLRRWRWLACQAAGSSAVRVAFMSALAVANEPDFLNGPEASMPRAGALLAAWTLLYGVALGAAFVASGAGRVRSSNL